MGATRAPGAWRSSLNEIALVAVGYALYSLIRDPVVARRPVAVGHAWRIVHLEKVARSRGRERSADPSRSGARAGRPRQCRTGGTSAGD